MKYVIRIKNPHNNEGFQYVGKLQIPVAKKSLAQRYDYKILAERQATTWQSRGYIAEVVEA